MKILNNRIFHAIIFFLLTILFFLFVFFPSINKINTDFPNYYVSANMFLDGKNLKDAYDNVEFNKHVLLYGIENQIVSFIPYPPVNSLLMIPFAKLEPLTAKLCWNILNIMFFLTSAYFISRISELNFFLTAILFFLSGYAFVNNFFFGQAYLLVLACFSSSLYFLMKEKDILSAFLFSLSVLLKFYTIFFLVFFLLRKKFKIFLASISFIIFFNILAFATTGIDVNLFYYSEIMPRISDGWIGTGYAPEFQSVSSMLHKLFYYEPSLNPDPLMESPDLYFILKYSFYFGVLFISIFVVINSQGAKLQLVISLFCFVCMLLLPVNASYQYVILIPAIAILVQHYLLRKEYFKIGIILFLFFVMNSPFTVFMVNYTKNTSYFFLGYIKLFVLIYFWIDNLIILRKSRLARIKDNSFFRYSLATLILISISTRMSLSFENEKVDDAKNILINPSYLISMPSVREEKIIFTECKDEKFTLNSNFGLKYDRENVFEPTFLNDSVIIYMVVDKDKKYYKALNIYTNVNNPVDESFIETRDLSYTEDGTMKCFSKDGQIYIETILENKIKQITFSNSFNTRPVFAENDTKIIFCSDRNRGVGFTTLYVINLRNH